MKAASISILEVPVVASALRDEQSEWTSNYFLKAVTWRGEI
jgi:hypothetical protein